MTSTDLPLALPLVVAPMAGGPTSPALVAAVCAEGGTGFLPGGYLTDEALGQKLDELDALL
uniref:nitronate monooxygenase n=1 Tax=Luteococcus sp. TaxID=1969402 RepID=UPI00373560D6